MGFVIMIAIFYQLFIFVLKFKMFCFFFLMVQWLIFTASSKRAVLKSCMKQPKALLENCAYIPFEQRNRKDWPVKWVTYFMVFTTDCKVFQLSIMHSGDAKGEIKIVRLKQGF